MILTQSECLHLASQRAAFQFDQVPDDIRDLIGRNDLHANLKKEELRLVNSALGAKAEEHAKLFAKTVPFEGAHWSQYLPWIPPMENPTGFEQWNLRCRPTQKGYKPFLEMRNLTADKKSWIPPSLILSDRLKKQASKRYRPFSPDIFRRFHWSPRIESEFRVLESVFRKKTKGTHFVAGRVLEKSTAPFWLNRRLKVTRTNDLSWYAQYLKMYEAFHRFRPNLKDTVMSEDISLFENSIKSGLVFVAHQESDSSLGVQSQFVGTLALMPGYNELLDGLCVAEKMIDPNHWGQGFGETLEWHALRAVPKGVWVRGEVNLQNTPSLRSALRNDRFVLGTWFEEPCGFL